MKTKQKSHYERLIAEEQVPHVGVLTKANRQAQNDSDSTITLEEDISTPPRERELSRSFFLSPTQKKKRALLAEKVKKSSEEEAEAIVDEANAAVHRFRTRSALVNTMLMGSTVRRSTAIEENPVQRAPLAQKPLGEVRWTRGGSPPRTLLEEITAVGHMLEEEVL